MNEKLRFRILQLCSGHYLNANIPNNWNDYSEEEQHEFLKENVWEPFETYDVEFVWGCITSAARATHEFVERSATQEFIEDNTNN